MMRLHSLAVVVCSISAAHAGGSADRGRPTITAAVEDVGAPGPGPRAIRSLQPLGDPVASDDPPKSNPLSSIPLSALSATRERPLFAATRRPPPANALTGPAPEAAVNDKASKPEQPPFALMGTIISSDARIAVVLDQTTNEVKQIRQGKAASGWSAVFVGARAISLQKGDLVRTVTLPSLDSAPGVTMMTGGAPR